MGQKLGSNNHKRKYFNYKKIVIKLLTLHKNIFPRVHVHMNKGISGITIYVHLIYTTNKGMHKFEHNNIK